VTVSVESKRRSKLPPRLVKQREQKEKEKHQRGQLQPADQAAVCNTQDMMPKIENWNNEMANNLMSPAKGATSTEQTASQQDSPATRSRWWMYISLIVVQCLVFVTELAVMNN